MNKQPGFDFTEAQAANLLKPLERCVSLLGEAAAIAERECDPASAGPFREHMASILADLGWEVMEQGIYKQHPKLRPMKSALYKPQGD